MLKGATATTEEDLITILKIVVGELRNRGFEASVKLERTQNIEI